jgi:WD40 repeat protein
LLLIVTGLSLGWAVLSKTEALRSEAEAQRSEVKAQQEALLARYGELLSTDPARSLSTALDVWRADETDPRAETAVRLSLDADTEQLRLPADSRLAWTSEFSPDGKAVLTAGADGVAKMFDATTGRPLHSFQLSGSEVRPELLAASFSPDGRLVLTVTSTGDVRLFDAATAEDLGLLTHAGPAVHAVWSMLGDHPVVLVSDWNSPEVMGCRGRKVIATYGKSNAGDAALVRWAVRRDSRFRLQRFKNASRHR